MTPAERVLDASIVAALLFNEPSAPRVRAMIEGSLLSAPDFLLVEVASVGSKKMRRGEPVEMSAPEIIDAASLLLDRMDAVADLVPAAYDIARVTRISLYDALYLALAKARTIKVLTLDGRLARAAAEAGLGDLIEAAPT